MMLLAWAKYKTFKRDVTITNSILYTFRRLRLDEVSLFLAAPRVSIRRLNCAQVFGNLFRHLFVTLSSSVSNVLNEQPALASTSTDASTLLTFTALEGSSNIVGFPFAATSKRITRS